ncbi:MAG: class I SAM-dependent methyltransferase [Hyphomonadaceae bacterium]|nr:class I SAM-dependent methyltransferase [Hyphomonadaceae bacterium]
MSLRRTLVRGLRAARLAGVADRAAGAWAAWKARRENAAFRAAHPGRPTPDPRLIYEIQTYASLAEFDRSGRAHAAIIADVLQPLPPAAHILEWGCGPARILAPLAQLVPDAKLSGCDPNGAAIAWAAGALPAIAFRTIAPAPPASYPAGSFDAIYGVSILTHLDAAACRAWVAEIARLLKPDGVAALTLHTESSAAALPPADQARYRRGEAVALGGGKQGSRVFAFYLNPDGARALFAPHFAEVTHRPDVAAALGQDIWLLRAPRP